MSISWMPIAEYEARKKFLEEMKDIQNKILWGMYTPPKPREDDNVKLAWVVIKGERVMAGVDNQTMQGYKLREDVPTWKLPLEKLEYEQFDRWCTTFDV